MSTLFLFAKPENQNTEIPIAELEQIAREQRINAPQFSGVTNNGAVITVSAKSAQPAPHAPSVMQVNDIQLNLDGADGTTLRIFATEGRIDSKAETAQLLGLARLETSTGYMMETNDLTAQFKTGEVTSGGNIEVRAPYGKLTAGAVTIQSTKGDTAQRILFTNGVRLIYTPSSQSEVSKE